VRARSGVTLRVARSRLSRATRRSASHYRHVAAVLRHVQDRPPCTHDAVHWRDGGPLCYASIALLPAGPEPPADS